MPIRRSFIVSMVTLFTVQISTFSPRCERSGLDGHGMGGCRCVGVSEEVMVYGCLGAGVCVCGVRVWS